MRTLALGWQNMRWSPRQQDLAGAFVPTVLRAPGHTVSEEADRCLLGPWGPWSCPGCCMCGDSGESTGSGGQAHSPEALQRRELEDGRPSGGRSSESSSSTPSLSLLPGTSRLPSLVLSCVSGKGKKEVCFGFQPAGGLQTLGSCGRYYCQHLGESLQEAIFPEVQTATQFLEGKVLGDFFFFPTLRFNASQGAQRTPLSPL